MITIPKGIRKKKQWLKVCKEPGCEREFMGYGVSKYCDKHRDPKLRAKKERAASDHSKNAYIEHKFAIETIVEIPCRHPGCKTMFRVRLSPKQFIYPAMCERHRNEIINNHSR